MLEYAYETVECTIAAVKNYVDEWLRYQALWDLQVEPQEEKNSLKCQNLEVQNTYGKMPKFGCLLSQPERQNLEELVHFKA